MPPAGRGTLFAAFVFFALFFLVLLGSHATVLRLPYFWDELGQFIPAALDIFEQNAWIPHTTVPNVHPPGLMAFLALVWKLVAYSIPATRIAMLLIAAGGVFITFLLTIELCRNLS